MFVPENSCEATIIKPVGESADHTRNYGEMLESTVYYVTGEAEHKPQPSATPGGSPMFFSVNLTGNRICSSSPRWRA